MMVLTTKGSARTRGVGEKRSPLGGGVGRCPACRRALQQFGQAVQAHDGDLS